MSQHRAGSNPLYNNFPSYLLSDIHNRPHFGIVKPPLGITFVKCATCTVSLNIISSISALLASAARMLTMALAPLRRIILRELDVYHPDPRNLKYSIYSLVDTMACGHVSEFYLYNGLGDIVNAYTQNPVICAKSHRCRPCASLLAKKKPQSVPLTAATKAA